jgi:hypothetical protein
MVKEAAFSRFSWFGNMRIIWFSSGLSFIVAQARERQPDTGIAAIGAGVQPRSLYLTIKSGDMIAFR